MRVHPEGDVMLDDFSWQKSPILDLKSIDLLEMPGVVCHKNVIIGQCGCCDFPQSEATEFCFLQYLE